ncbi:vWA domain-containing protein [Mycoplana ramosa]|uniref:Pilus assembly protein TadG-related protein n=1 Tax=Mycoplana ramosa TaxID=40837 RepID=A0ABW3YW31_MYCRA
MKLATEKQGVLSRLAKDRRGNFGMMTALLLPVLLGAGGISIDVTKMMMTKNRLQDAADSAALAAASALANDGYSIEAAKLLALRFIETQMRSGGNVDGDGTDTKNPDNKDPSSFASSVVNIEETPTGKSSKAWVITVTASMDMDLNPLTRLLVKDKATITANTSAESATESKNALSMYLVLDKSGSMLANTEQKIVPVTSCYQYNDSGNLLNKNPISPCYVKKIEALKTAAGSLFDTLDAADPDTIYVRTGTVSYNSERGTTYKINWGTTASRTQVNALEGGGGTSSTAAMQAAYDKLMASTENTEHQKKNQQVPTKYIVFMTDGNNNNSSDDTKTLNICKTAKTAGVKIYTVAFMAPPRGQQLLSNCATPGSFFVADKMSDLVKAFEKIGQEAAATIARLTH